MGTEQRFDVPEADAFTVPYWRAAAEGRLLLRRCRAPGCGAVHHYPREFCPRCWSEDVEWMTASGEATLYTWSVVHRNALPPFGERVPYVAAVVELAEGPRMMTEITDCPEGALRIGMPLRAAFRDSSRSDGAGDAAHRDRDDGDAAHGGGAQTRTARTARTARTVPVFRPAHPADDLV